MPSHTNEIALEACIERHLTGGVSAMPLPGSSLVAGGRGGTPTTSKGAGYQRGKSTDFNAEFAIDETMF